MDHEQRKQIIAAAAVRMTVKPQERPPAPPRPPRLDPHLPGEITRLEALVAERERQITALREQHRAKAAEYESRLRDLDARVRAAGDEMSVLHQLTDHLQGEAQGELDAAAAECARITAAAQERATGVRREAQVAAAEAGQAERELDAVQLERVTLEGRAAGDLAALLDQADRLQHGRYADAQRRLPELRARLAARQAEVAAWTAAQAAAAPSAAEPIAAETPDAGPVTAPAGGPST